MCKLGNVDVSRYRLGNVDVVGTDGYLIHRDIHTLARWHADTLIHGYCNYLIFIVEVTQRQAGGSHEAPVACLRGLHGQEPSSKQRRIQLEGDSDDSTSITTDAAVVDGDSEDSLAAADPVKRCKIFALNFTFFLFPNKLAASP